MIYMTARNRTVEFWNRLDRSTEHWLWTGMKCQGGYGSVKVNGKQMRAHRLAWIFVNGEIPDGLCVLHKCDIRLCCNPNCLFLGTRKDNSDDKVAKGRHVWGAAHPRAKLTQDQADEIRARYVAGGTTKQMLADEYGVDHAVVSNIIHNKSYRSPSSPKEATTPGRAAA